MSEFDFQAFIQAVADGMTAAETGIRTHRIFLHGAWTDDRYEGEPDFLAIVHDGQDAGFGPTARGRVGVHKALSKAGFDVTFTLALITHSNWEVQGRMPGTSSYDAAKNGIEIFRSVTIS